MQELENEAERVRRLQKESRQRADRFDRLNALESQIRALARDERCELLVRLGLDEDQPIDPQEIEQRVETSRRLGSLLDWISVEDSEGAFRLRPVISIERTREKVRQEIAQAKGIAFSERKPIDIIAAVANNPVNIGHPLILFAIQRWVQTIRHHRALASTKAASAKKFTLAKKHLKGLMAALIQGAEDRAIPFEYARIWRYRDENDRSHTPKWGVVFKAWELLGKESIKRTRNIDLKIAKVEGELRADQFTDSNVNEIGEFLKANRSLVVRRRTRIGMIRAYDAWRLGLSQDTLRRYTYEANKQASDMLDDDGSAALFDSLTPTAIADALGDWFALPSTQTK